MSNLSTTPAESWDIELTQDRTTVFNRLGRGLGNLFLSAKHKAKNKYREVTSGINQSIEAEEERRELAFHLELQELLNEQAGEYELQMYQLKRKAFGWACLLAFLAFIAGMATVVYLHLQNVI